MATVGYFWLSGISPRVAIPFVHQYAKHLSSTVSAPRTQTQRLGEENLPRSPSRCVVRMLLKLTPNGAVELVKGSKTLQMQGALVKFLVAFLDFYDAFAIPPDYFCQLVRSRVLSKKRFYSQRKTPDAFLSTIRAAV